MNPYQIHADGIQDVESEMETDCPQITWKKQPWNIVPGTSRLRKDASVGGFEMNCDFTFTALASTFNTTAVDIKNRMLNTEVGYLGDAYKPYAIWIIAGGLQIRVEANSINQKA